MGYRTITLTAGNVSMELDMADFIGQEQSLHTFAKQLCDLNVAYERECAQAQLKRDLEEKMTEFTMSGDQKSPAIVAGRRVHDAINDLWGYMLDHRDEFGAGWVGRFRRLDRIWSAAGCS